MQSSWKLGLRNSFKNFRRGSKKQDSESEEPPSKCLKLYDANQLDDITDEEYEQAVKELQGTTLVVNKALPFLFAEAFKNKGKGKKGSQHGIVKQLMEKTKVRRHRWI